MSSLDRIISKVDKEIAKVNREKEAEANKELAKLSFADSLNAKRDAFKLDAFGDRERAIETCTDRLNRLLDDNNKFCNKLRAQYNKLMPVLIPGRRIKLSLDRYTYKYSETTPARGFLKQPTTKYLEKVCEVLTGDSNLEKVKFSDIISGACSLPNGNYEDSNIQTLGVIPLESGWATSNSTEYVSINSYEIPRYFNKESIPCGKAIKLSFNEIFIPDKDILPKIHFSMALFQLISMYKEKSHVQIIEDMAYKFFTNAKNPDIEASPEPYFIEKETQDFFTTVFGIQIPNPDKVNCLFRLMEIETNINEINSKCNLDSILIRNSVSCNQKPTYPINLSDFMYRHPYQGRS